MQIKFFRIAVNNPHDEEEALNAFLNSHKVLTMQREFVTAGQESYWAIAVEYLATHSQAGNERSTRNRKDYKKELTPEAFLLFSRLRDWRKEMAEQEGIPVYTVFTNEQLARIAAGPVTTKNELQKIEGVGEGRLEKFGQILEVMRRETGQDEATAESVSTDS